MTITLPGQYAKFITAVLGEALAYLQVYGATWHLAPALTMAGVALAVPGVPNTPRPAPRRCPWPPRRHRRPPHDRAVLVA